MPYTPANVLAVMKGSYFLINDEQNLITFGSARSAFGLISPHMQSPSIDFARLHNKKSLM